MSISLEPPATNDIFGYCPTDSVSVNVTCEVEEMCASTFCILPFVGIGMDHFSLSNKKIIAKWGITVISQNLTTFELPLNDTTNGLAVYCYIGTSFSSNITLQSGISIYMYRYIYYST